MKQLIKITQTQDQPVTTEVIAEAIVAISSGVKKLLAGPLNEAAIVLLITHATPAPKRGYIRNPISAKVVRAVLHGMESLEREYLKPKKP